MGRDVMGEQADIQVPTEDGSIAQALTDLEAKLEAWSAAMRAAEASLAELSAESRRRVEAEDRHEIDRTVADDAVGEADGAAAECPVASDDTVAEPIAGDPDLVSTEAQVEPEEVEETQPESESIEVATVEADVGEAGVDSEEASDPSRGASEDDDEALLATLDSETAKAIRVMRRLAPEKKSVRELLSEYEAQKADEPEEQPQKKSWFHRRR